MPNEFSSIKDFIQRGDLETAISQLIAVVETYDSRFRNEVILQAAGIRQLDGNVRRGVLNSQEERIERNRIIFALLELVDEIEHEQNQKGDQPSSGSDAKDTYAGTSLAKQPRKKIDVLLVTATDAETQAVLTAAQQKTLSPYKPIFIGDKTYLNLGEVSGASIGLVYSEMGTEGPGGSSLTIFEAIERLHPSMIIMVGIAFGMNPDKQQIGDILISRQLMNYAPQRIGTDPNGEVVLRPRGDRVTASIKLLDRFRYGGLSWKGAKVRFGLMVSGPHLVDNYHYRRQLQQLEPEAIGGEMEGSGLYAAAHRKKVDWIVVKAICDWADGNKSVNKDKYQRLAATNAAEFTLHTLAQGGFA